jgi:hypothetical protein
MASAAQAVSAICATVTMTLRPPITGESSLVPDFVIMAFS